MGIETRTAFQLWSSERITKLRLQTTQGHGLLRRTTQPSLPVDLFSEQLLTKPKYSKTLFTRGFSQIPNSIQAQSCKLLDYSATTFLIDQNPNRENKMSLVRKKKKKKKKSTLVDTTA